MITKLLLTIGVIFAAWLVLRNRQRRMSAPAPGPRLQQTPVSRGMNPWKWGGYLLVVVMILGSGLFLYEQWQEGYRIVTVTVVNTQTGERIDYQAHRMDVEARSFITLDNREVSVAANERIEVRSASTALSD